MDRRQWATMGRQVVVVVAVLWATSGLISAQAKPDPRCNVINGLTRDPFQCNSYLICSSQQIMRIIPCPSGMMFDEGAKQCTDAANVKCGYRPIVPAEPEPRCDVDFGSINDPNQCDSYFICFLYRVIGKRRCPNGQKFDVVTRNCNDSAYVTCGYTHMVTACWIEHIDVTIVVNNSLTTPPYKHSISLTAPKQSLRNFMLMAAGSDRAFQFETTVVGDQGEFVDKIGYVGAYNAGQTWRFWDMRDTNGLSIAANIDAYKPNNGDVVTFNYLQVNLGG